MRVVLLLAALLCLPDTSDAYSVLAHEANVDALWDSGIRPLLARRFPRATPGEILGARAYAYGGSVIQDVGYYPFGSRFFSNLVHYVKSGDFVKRLIADALDVNEYAFALGALAHYSADNTGHPEAVNRAVPIIFPKLRAKFGDRVTYFQSPARHVIVEFSFDVVEAASGKYVPDAYHAFIGFEVARPVLERAFRETYGLEVKEVFGDVDLAIATYRFAVSQLVPEITRKLGKKASAYTYTRKQFEREFGTKYRRPGLLARFVTLLYRLLPKIGPLKPLSFTTPPPEAQALFEQSFSDTRASYARALAAVGDGTLDLPNTDLDTGRPARAGEYELADTTLAELEKRLKQKAQ
jgi:hypothetical protein